MCIKSVGRIAYYHRGHIALKHGSDWNIPMSEFHLANIKKYLPAVIAVVTVLWGRGGGGWIYTVGKVLGRLWHSNLRVDFRHANIAI